MIITESCLKLWDAHNGAVFWDQKRRFKNSGTSKFNIFPIQAAVAAELADVQAEVEKLKKQKATGDRNARSLDDQLNELKGKLEESEAAFGEAEAKGAKSAGDAASSAKALEEAESKLAAAGKAH